MNRRQFILSALVLTGTAATRGLLAAAPATKIGTTGKVTAVDCHAHVFHRGLKFVPERTYTPDYDAFAEQYLGMLDKNGMSHGVIIPISIVGTDNSYTLEAMKMAKGRLRGLAVVDPEKDLATLNDLDQAGIAGIRMNLSSGRPIPDVSQGAWKELVAECVRLNWHVEIYDKASRLEGIMAPLLKAGANVVVDHFGGPDPKLGVDDPGFRFLAGAAGSRKVWVKLSAPYRSSLKIATAAAPILLEHFGPERLVWGSDWPFTNFEKSTLYPEMRALLDNWVPDAQQRQVILADTPSKLYHF